MKKIVVLGAGTAGTMMANAARDPVFFAAIAIARQDAPDSAVEHCVRCHSPTSYVRGHSLPADGSALDAARVMVERKVLRLFVLDEGKPVGVLLSCLLAVGGFGRAVAQSPDEPPTEVPVVVEAVAAAAAASAEADAAQASDDAQAPEDDAGAGDVPMDAQTDAAAVLAGGTNSPSGSTNFRSGPPPSRREGRSRDRGERGTRDWRSSFGSASRSKSGGTNSAPEIPKTDYAYFKVVNDRNIFNPGRQPNRPDRPVSREVKRTPKVDAFSLVGTLRSEKGDMAFFDGST